MNHQQQKPHGDASMDNRKTLMVMMNQWEEKKEPHGNESINNPPKKKKQSPMVMNERFDTNDIHGDQSITREWK
jgi:hypothetical protein